MYVRRSNEAQRHRSSWTSSIKHSVPICSGLGQYWASYAPCMSTQGEEVGRSYLFVARASEQLRWRSSCRFPGCFYVGLQDIATRLYIDRYLNLQTQPGLLAKPYISSHSRQRSPVSLPHASHPLTRLPLDIENGMQIDDDSTRYS